MRYNATLGIRIVVVAPALVQETPRPETLQIYRWIVWVTSKTRLKGPVYNPSTIIIQIRGRPFIAVPYIIPPLYGVENIAHIILHNPSFHVMFQFLFLTGGGEGISLKPLYSPLYRLSYAYKRSFGFDGFVLPRAAGGRSLGARSVYSSRREAQAFCVGSGRKGVRFGV